jgi:hypothetical protein
MRLYLCDALRLHSVVLRTLLLRNSIEGRGVLEQVPTSVVDPVLKYSKQMKKHLESKPFSLA